MLEEIETKNCFNKLDVEKLIKLIMTGKAILFAGAGFSMGSVSIIGEKLKLSKDLAKEIDKITDEDTDGDLYEASQNAIDSGKSLELIDLLKKLFLVQDVKEWHLNILKLPWRRFYTTNYDNVIELSGLKNGKSIVPVTIGDDKEKLQNNICLHINGYVENLTTDTLNSSFKLTESSYLHQDTLNNSPWVDVFESDIKRASAVVFIGYSLYDYDIQKLLFKHDVYKDKVYFITSNKSCEKIKREKEYGKVINRGIEGFSQLIDEHKDLTKNKQLDEYYYESFKMIKLPEAYREPSHDDIRNFLIFGKNNIDYLTSAIIAPERNRHIIIPSWIEECRYLLLENKYLHISGDLGTGKTIGLKLFEYLLRKEGEVVFFLDTSYGDYEGDIQYIINNFHDVYIFIDNVDENVDVLKYIYEINSPKITCISASRGSIFKYIDDKLLNRVKFYNIDQMNEDDIEQLVSIVENTGASASYSRSALKSKIESDHNHSLPSFLLDFMQSDHISREIKLQISQLDGLANNKYQSTIIALSFLGAVNKKLHFSIIQDMTGNTNIRNAELLNNDVFKMFFQNEGYELEAKSATFLRFILQNYYLDNLKKEEFLKFAKVADDYKQSRNLNDRKLNSVYEDIFKKLMQYYTLSKLFKENNFDAILNYFEKLQIEISWIHREPHYWLQLSLLNLARHRLDIAKDLIDKARRTAENKTYDYDFAHIDTVEARYYIELGLDGKTNMVSCFDYFCTADDLLKKHEASDNKYRQIDKYMQVYNKIIHGISPEKLIIFQGRVQHQLHRIYELEDEKYPGIDKLYLVYNSKTKLEKILHKLKS